MTMHTKSTGTKEEIISYQKLRTFIGIIGIFLPIAVVLGCYLNGDGRFSWQPSISHYYYSKMHFVFVCTLCVLGGFLITYKGKKEFPWESRISNFAGYCAFAIAAYPTPLKGYRNEPGRPAQYLQIIKEVSAKMGVVHFISAGLLFTCFIIFCLVFFQKPDKLYTTSNDQLKFRRRKNFYKFCGYGIALSIIGIGTSRFYDAWEFTTFFFETTALWLFGSAWLIKGSEFWKKYPVLKSMIGWLR